MSLRESIETRISDCRSKLETLDRAISEEISNGYSNRRKRVLNFLHSERKAYSLALTELTAVCRDLGMEEKENGLSDVEWDGLSGFNRVQDNKEQLPPIGRSTYRILTRGGIGDTLLITPTLRALKRRYPACKIYVYCQRKTHEEALKNNIHIDRLKFLGRWEKALFSLLSIFKLAEVRQLEHGNAPLLSPYKGLRPIRFLSFGFGNLLPSLFYRNHAAEIIGEMAGVEIDDPRPDCYMTETEEAEGREIVSKYPNPVVIHVAAESTQNKDWPIRNWRELVLNNPNYNFLQIGLHSEELVEGVVDLKGTSIREAFAIIKAARAFIGVESVFAHAATALRAPAVVLFGPSTPAIWGYPQNQNLYRARRCSPCLDLLLNAPCPYGTSCMSDITATDVERALSSVMTRVANRNHDAEPSG